MSDAKMQTRPTLQNLWSLHLLVYWKEFQSQISLDKRKFYLTYIFIKAYLPINYIWKERQITNAGTHAYIYKHTHTHR